MNVKGNESGSISSICNGQCRDFKSVDKTRENDFFFLIEIFRCLNGLLKLIEQERQGETIDRGLVRNLIRMLIDLHVKFFIFSIQKKTEKNSLDLQTTI